MYIRLCVNRCTVNYRQAGLYPGLYKNGCSQAVCRYLTLQIPRTHEYIIIYRHTGLYPWTVQEVLLRLCAAT